MRIEFDQFTRFDQAELAAMAMEITAGVVGDCQFSDLPLDEDQLLSEMLEKADEFNIETEVEYYQEEDFAGRQLAREKFGSLVSENLGKRQHVLRSSHPFELELGNEPNLIRHEVGDISPVYFATFVLTLFLLLEDEEVIQVPERNRRNFRGKFGKIFELVSAYALSAEVEGIVWWTGHSRGRNTFLRQLNELVVVVGNGVVRTEDQLGANQVHVSDGGIDAIGVSTHEGLVQADTICYLLGATYQHRGRRNKIVGQREINRFRRFFDDEPTVVFQGILSIPYSYTIHEAEDCRDQSCLYFPRASIERNLGIASTKEYRHGTLQYVKKLHFKMRENLSLAVSDLEIARADNTYLARELISIFGQIVCLADQ